METWLFEIWNSIWLWLCQGIYIFISALYQVFEKVASVNLFNADIFNQLTGKIYIIMAIGMLFIFAYNLVLMIINPDEKKNSGGMNKIVKQSVISIVLVVLLPVIFNWLYIFQTDVLESQVISTIFLGGVGNVTPDSKDCGNDYDCSCDFTNYGLESYNNKKKWTNYLTGTSNTTDNSGQLSDFCKDYRDNKNGSQKGAYAIAPIVFSTFYRPTHFDFDTCVEHLQDSGHSVLQDDDDKKICVNYFYDVTASKYTGNIYPFTSDSYLKEIVSNSDKDGMEFHWIMAIVAGVLAVYMFLCYSMAVGVRVAKLGFLQIISPVAVMMKIVPKKEDIFDKWFKELKNTYLDVFFRVIIIDFSLFAIGLVPDIMSTMWKSNSTGDGNFFIKALSLVFVILGMLKFAQDAPALFKEFFGASGKFSLKSPKKQLTENKLAMGGLGAATTFGASKANQIKNFGKTWNNEDATFGSRAHQISSLINPISSLKRGFNGTKDAKNLGDFTKGVTNSTTDELTDKGIVYRAKSNVTDFASEIGRVATTDFSPQDTVRLQRETNTLDQIKKNRDSILSILDDHAGIKNINSYYEQQVKKASEAGDFNLVQALGKQKKEDILAARRAVAEEKKTGKAAEFKMVYDASTGVTKLEATNASTIDDSKIDISYKQSIDKFNQDLSDNFSTVQSALSETNTKIKDASGNELSTFDSMQNAINAGDIDVFDKIGKSSDRMSNANRATMRNIEDKKSGNK